MKPTNTLEWVALILVLIGGLNWGLFGLIQLNLVALIFGSGFLARLIYILVGVGAVYIALYAFGILKK